MNFDMNEFSSKKICDLLAYFNGDISIKEVDKKSNRAYKLDEAFKIYNSDMLTIRKIDAIRQIFKSSIDVKKSFSDLEKYQGNQVLSKYYEMSKIIYNFLKSAEENNLVGISKDLLQKEEDGYFDSYFGACQLLDLYLSYDESEFVADFCKSYNVSKVDFFDLMEIINHLNPNLYDKFLEKYNSDSEKRKINSIEKFNNLYQGITTGYVPNEEEFNELEAFKNLPFYDDLTSKEVLTDFGIRSAIYVDQRLRNLFDYFDSSKTRVIINYLHENRIVGNSISPITEKEIYSTNYIIREKELTKEDKDAIIRFMKDNKVPFIVRAFNVVVDNYVDGSIDLKSGKMLVKEGFDNGNTK